MKKIIGLGLLVLSTQLMATDLDCNIQLNLGNISETQVTTALDQKTSIDAAEGIYASVTEKKNGHFVVEAYLVDYDIRIYGEGSLKDNSDKLSASAWGRASMVDIECHLSQNLKKHK